MHACHNLIQPVLTCLYFFLIWYERRPCGPNLLHFVVGNLSTPPVVIGTLLPRTFVPGSQSSNLDLQISRIWRETRAFEVYLTLSRLRLKSHAFRPHLKFLLQTKVTKNCYHHMRFLGSNVTEMPWREDPWDVGIKREVQGREGKEGVSHALEFCQLDSSVYGAKSSSKAVYQNTAIPHYRVSHNS